MELTVVGCSGSIPGPDSPASCYLIEHDGFRLVLDLGSGALGSLMNFIDLRTIDAVAFSHLHADHCLDLTGLYVGRRYGGYGTGERLPVFGPSDTAGRMARAYDLAEQPGFTHEFDFLDVSRAREIGPFRLTTAPMAHPVEAYGLRLEADGRSLAYTGDTGPNERLAPLARDANVLLAEAAFVEGAVNPPDLHLTGREAGQVAHDAGVGELVVTHVPPWYNPLDALAEAIEVYDGPVQSATVGLQLSI